MTVEQIEIRKILTQMLADAGINRETLKDLVKQILNEKIDQAIKTAEHQTNLNAKIDRLWAEYLHNGIERAAKAAIVDKINCYFKDITVTLDFGNTTRIV